MTNVYTSSPVKRHNYSVVPKQGNEILRLEIAKGFSDSCTKSLLFTLRQMNKEITHFIITDLITKGLE